MPVRRSGRGEAVPRRPEVERRAVRLRVRRRVPQEPAPEPRHLPVSVQREPPVVHAAGKEVQPEHLQVGVKGSRESTPALATWFIASSGREITSGIRTVLPAKRARTPLWPKEKVNCSHSKLRS